VAGEVWIIDSDQWPRASLRAELIERGYDATGFVTIRDALVRLIVDRGRRPALIVCDLHEQGLDEKLATALFREGVPVVAIAGVPEADDEAVRALPWRAFLRRPVTIGAVAETVRRLAPPV
jgi:DNA-binding NtrC family response regulator